MEYVVCERARGGVHTYPSVYIARSESSLIMQSLQYYDVQI